MGNKKPTRDDHFVPRGYLKKFALDPRAKAPQIYQFDIDGIAEHKPVPIRSICYKDRLYEIKNAEGQIIAENGIENSIRIFENAFYKVRNNVFKRLLVSNWQSVFSDTERKSLLLMVMLQLLRYEETTQRFKDIWNRQHPEDTKTPEHIKDIIAKIACLPLFLNYDNITMTVEIKKFKQWANNPPILHGFVKQLSSHNMCLGYRKDAAIWICDRPVIVRDFYPNEFDLVIYPISPEHVLYIYSKNILFSHKDNSVFEMTDSEVALVNKEIVVNANRWIYSNYELSKHEQQQIFTIRKEINESLIATNGGAYWYPIDTPKESGNITLQSEIYKKKKENRK